MNSSCVYNVIRSCNPQYTHWNSKQTLSWGSSLCEFLLKERSGSSAKDKTSNVKKENGEMTNAKNDGGDVSMSDKDVGAACCA